MSRLRPAMIVSIAGVAGRSVQTGSLALRQLITIAPRRTIVIVPGFGRAFRRVYPAWTSILRGLACSAFWIRSFSTPCFSSAGASGVEFFRQREQAPEARQADFGMRSLHALRHLEVHVALDRQRVAVYLQVEPVLRNTGKVRVQGDAGCVLEYVDRRQQRRLFARCLRLPDDAGLVVHGFLLHWMLIRRGCAASWRLMLTCSSPSR
jgi:hypothetical protein